MFPWSTPPLRRFWADLNELELEITKSLAELEEMV